MLLMLPLGGQLRVWKVKRQGSDAADAPSWWATGGLEGEAARV